jgi:ABC-type lipoprotein export system ATPase subunit
MAEPLLAARGLDKTYRRGTERVQALRGVDLALYPRELVTLVGPSGSGKSSLLGCWPAGEPPDAGSSPGRRRGVRGRPRPGRSWLPCPRRSACWRT